MTAKEVTLNYLKDIQRDLDNAITNAGVSSSNDLTTERTAINNVISLVQEAEGE